MEESLAMVARSKAGTWDVYARSGDNKDKRSKAWCRRKTERHMDEGKGSTNPTQPNRGGSTIHVLQPMGEMHSITSSGKIIHVCLHCIQEFQLLA